MAHFTDTSEETKYVSQIHSFRRFFRDLKAGAVQKTDDGDEWEMKFNFPINIPIWND